MREMDRNKGVRVWTRKRSVFCKRSYTSKSDNDIRSSSVSSFFSKDLEGGKACMACPPTTSTRRARTGKRVVCADEEEEQRAQHKASSRLRKRASRDMSSGTCIDRAECILVELALISNTACLHESAQINVREGHIFDVQRNSTMREKKVSDK